MPDRITPWLEQLGLIEYAEVFKVNAIDFRALPELSDDDLQELGLKLGHRRILQRAVAELVDRDKVGRDSAEIPVAYPDADTNLAAWERHPGERKPVTMLFADITGSTAITEKLDPEEAHELLYGATQLMCEAIEKYHGTVCRFMGDGVMAMFGAPISSEHHAISACEAALEMQRQIGKYSHDIETGYGSNLSIRVGLHSGEVVVLTVGEGDGAEYDASGPTVPIAARMEQLANPGEVFLTSTTRALAADRIETSTLDPVSVKGVSEPVKVFTLRRVTQPEESKVYTRNTSFIGRRSELNQFRGILDTCIEEAHGQSVYIRGEPGIGKTRLVEEFIRIAANNGFISHRGLVLPFGVGKGQDAIRSLVRSLLDVPVAGGESIRQQIAAAALDKGRLHPDQAVFLNDLLDIPQAAEQRALYDAMDHATRNKGKRQVVVNLLTTQGDLQPVLVVIEDVHWADAITLAHLAALSKAVADCPAILVMTSRIEGDQVDHSWRSTTQGSPFLTIDLGPLREQDSIALISQFIDSADPIATSCLERAAGNPLFLEQLLQSAKEGTAQNLPDTIQSLVLARVDRLEPDQKQALQIASVIGQRFDIDVLRKLMQKPDLDCQDLVEHNLVRPEGAGYLFAHALIQESVYGSLIRSQREMLHRNAASIFGDRDPVLRAQHLDRANDPAAASAFLNAAVAQMTELHFETTLRLTERGIEIAEDLDTKYELVCFQGDALRETGVTEKSIEMFATALEIAQNDIQRCRAMIGMIKGLRIADRHQKALDLLDAAEAVAVSQNLLAEQAELYYLRGNILFPLGKIDGCLKAHESALALFQKIGSKEGEALSLGGLGDAHYLRGHMRSAFKLFRSCVEVCQKQNYNRIEVANRPMMGWTRIHSMEFTEALEDALTTAKMAADVTHHRAEIMGVLLAGLIELETGRYAEAHRHLQRSQELTQMMGARHFECQVLTLMARLSRAQDRLNEARNFVQQAVNLLREVGMTFYGPSALAVWAMLVDDPVESKKALEEAEKVLDADCVAHNHIWFARIAIDHALAIGDWESAERYAARLEAYTKDEPLSWADFIADRGRALAAWGRGIRCEDTRREIRRLCELADKVGLVPVASNLESVLLAN